MRVLKSNVMEVINKLGKLNSGNSIFNENVRLIVSERQGIIIRANVNDFNTNKDCEDFLKICTSAPEMFDMLKVISNKEIINGKISFDLHAMSLLKQLLTKITE